MEKIGPQNVRRVRWLRHTVSAGTLASVLAGCGGAGTVDQEPDTRTPEVIDAEIADLRESHLDSPTTVENSLARAVTARDWANRLARDGRAVSPALFADVSELVRDRGASSQGEVTRLDARIQELGLLDGDPVALGQVRFEDPTPVKAGSWTTVEQTFVVGSRPLREGAVIALGRQPFSDMGNLQADDPAAPNFVSVRSTSQAARFSATRLGPTGRAGEPESDSQLLGFVLEGSSLASGQSLTIVYGRKSGGSRGLRAQTTSTDSWKLPLFVDFDGSGTFFSPKLPALRVRGAEPVAVDGFAPAVVGVGESFDLHVRTRDVWLNRASGDIPGYQVTLNGEDHSEVPAASQAISVLRSLRLTEPGVYRFGFRSLDPPLDGTSAGTGAIVGTSQPIWVVEQPQRRIFWGDLHAHTELSHGQGTIRHAVDFARDDARLDFLGVTEHDLWLHAGSWQALRRQVERGTSDSDLAMFLGYEWTADRASGGNHAVLFRGTDAQLVPSSDARDVGQLAAALLASNEARDVLVVAHGDVAANWRAADELEVQRLVEIQSQHGTVEWLGDFYAQAGHQVGFVGGSDDHLGRPGLAGGRPDGPRIHGGALTAALAAEKSRDAIWGALVERVTYATSGARILLDATLNGFPMGSTQSDSDERRVSGRVSGTAAIDHIDLIKNGLVIYSRDYADVDLAEELWLQIGLQSQTEVLGSEHDNPRPARLWSGSMVAEGAGIVEVQGGSLDNPYRERALLTGAGEGVDETDGSSARNTPSDAARSVTFRVETRGDRETLLVRLTGVSTRSKLTIDLEPSRELAFGSDFERRPASLPAVSIEVEFEELAEGRVVRPIAVGDHTDRVTLQAVDRNASRDVSFEFIDVANPRPGDYYYLRVVQLDGETAWSSPFWVGR